MNEQRTKLIAKCIQNANADVKEAIIQEEKGNTVAAINWYKEALNLLDKAKSYEKEEIKKTSIENRKQEIEKSISRLAPAKLTEPSRPAVSPLPTTLTKTTPLEPAKHTAVTFNSISGLKEAKEAIYEALIYPQKFKVFFKDGMNSTNAILLYGPPGTGKTQLARAVATEINCTFYSITSADILDKYQGESEQKVKNIFRDARDNSPSVIFMDEVDSILSERSDTNSETSIRIKTLFMMEMNELTLSSGIFVLAATNIPWNIESAIQRRFTKKIYVPLPDTEARIDMFRLKTAKLYTTLTESDFKELAEMTDGYSGSDINNFVSDVSSQPFRKYRDAQYFAMKVVNGAEKWVPCDKESEHSTPMKLLDISPDQIEPDPICLADFKARAAMNKKSVSNIQLDKYKEFTENYGMNAN